MEMVTHGGMLLAATPRAPSERLLGVDLMMILTKQDLVGYLCMGLLITFSICSWGVMLLKFTQISAATRQTKAFIEQCVAGVSSLDEAYKNAGNYPDSPVSQLLREAYLELEMENWYREGYGKTVTDRLEVARAGIERVLERTITMEIDHLESYLIFLATTSNACPFIGLFGTVWGVMASFQAIARMGTASMASLAPGLSTALIATIGGLAAALPASVMYNYLTNKVRILTSRMDSFALELSNIIQKQLAKTANS